MSMMMVALFFAPGIVIGSILWRGLSRPQASLRYLAIASITALAEFFALQFFMLFALRRIVRQPLANSAIDS
jgi:hypothetical protein